MMKIETFHLGNEVEITVNNLAQDGPDTSIDIDGKNVCWISLPDLENFKKDLQDVIAKYRI